MSKDLDGVRKSTLSTLKEIDEAERVLKQACGDVSDPFEWMELRDIVSRIERRLRASNAAQ